MTETKELEEHTTDVFVDVDDIPLSMFRISIFKTFATENITNLYLDRCRIDNNKARVVATWMRTNTTIKKLCLSDNPIGAVGVEKITHALGANATLKKLLMDRIDAGVLGFDYMSKYLESAPSLSCLRFSSTYVIRSGEALIRKKLENNTSLSSCIIGPFHLSDPTTCILDIVKGRVVIDSKYQFSISPIPRDIITFKIDGSRLPEKHVVSFTGMIPETGSTQHVGIHDADFSSPAHAQACIENLAKIQNLKSITFSGCANMST